MANNTTSVSGNGLNSLNPLLSSTGSATAKKNDTLGKAEFLTLLITQLKNQDPEQPADSKEFAAQLAQFTQVEKLIDIDNKIGPQPGDVSSLAGYLGQNVTLDGSRVDVAGGQGGQLSVNLGQDASALTVQLLDSKGDIVGEKKFGQLSAGQQTIGLDGLSVPDGNYSVKVTALSARGLGEFSPQTTRSGLVTGFIPGADPKLIVNGQEISATSVKQVSVPPKVVPPTTPES